MRRSIDGDIDQHPDGGPLAATRGRFGEALAAAFLEHRGFRVLERNRRVGSLEVDLVATHRRELVIAEVRLRSRRDHGSVEESVDRRKRARLRSAGRRIWEELDRPDLSLRFDLVAILVQPEGLRLRHYPHFLDPSGPGTESLRSRR